MIAELNWNSLENRRKRNDLVFFFKIQTNLMDIPFPNDMMGPSPRRAVKSEEKRGPELDKLNRLSYLL